MEIAKWIVAFVAVYGFGGYIADAVVPSTAKQHLWNPAWPPHAKFHNGQTILLGILGGSLSLFILFGSRPLTFPLFLIAAPNPMYGLTQTLPRPLTFPLFLIAAAVAGMYWVAMAFATIFPGTAWFDPEFKDFTPRPLGFSPQQLLGYVLCVLLLAAVVLATLSH